MGKSKEDFMLERELSDQQPDQVSAIVRGVNTGLLDPLKAFIALKKIANEASMAIKALESDAIAEAEKYGKGEQQVFGVKIAVKNGPSRWDFKACSQYNERLKAMKEIEDNLKNTAKGKGEYIDKDTGEMWTLPVNIPGKRLLQVTFKNKQQ